MYDRKSSHFIGWNQGGVSLVTSSININIAAQTTKFQFLLKLLDFELM